MVGENIMSMAQRVNPHTLRKSITIDFKDEWIDEISICSLSLLDRKIKLEKIFGKYKYKEVVNKVKKLSR